VTTFYSDLYKLPPNGEPGSAPIYQGPSGPMHAGHVLAIQGAFDNQAGSAGFGASADDVLKLCAVPPGHKLLRAYLVPSADLDAGNSFTFNLGLTSAANAYASASNGLQGTTAFKVDADAVIAAAVSVDGDELILGRTAGALANAGTLRFVAEFAAPGR
jgi:hypothetical protein